MPKIIQVIESLESKGLGKDDGDPVRHVKRYYTLDGDLLAEHDAWELGRSKALPEDDMEGRPQGHDDSEIEAGSPTNIKEMYYEAMAELNECRADRDKFKSFHRAMQALYNRKLNLYPATTFTPEGLAGAWATYIDQQ